MGFIASFNILKSDLVVFLLGDDVNPALVFLAPFKSLVIDRKVESLAEHTS
jgi:hypothetical protein